MINKWAKASRKESEFKILEVLMEIGNFSFTEIQNKTKMSPNTINIRLKDLIEEKAIEKDEKRYKITDEGRTKYYKLINDLKSNKQLNFNPRIVESVELKDLSLIATSSNPTERFRKEWSEHLKHIYKEHLEFMESHNIGSSSCNFTAISKSIQDKEITSLKEK